MELTYDVISTNRNLGTKLSGEVAVRYGDTGLEDGTIKINFNGSAGQSFGTFLAGGIDLHLEVALSTEKICSRYCWLRP